MEFQPSRQKVHRILGSKVCQYEIWLNVALLIFLVISEMPIIGNGHVLGPNRHPSGFAHIKWTSLRSSLCRSGLGYCLSIWSLCNSRVHEGEIKTEESIAKSVRKDVKFRMMFKWSGCNSILNKFSILTGVYFIPSFMTSA